MKPTRFPHRLPPGRALLNVACVGLLSAAPCAGQWSWQKLQAPDSAIQAKAPIAQIQLADQASTIGLRRSHLPNLYLSTDQGQHWQIEAFEAYSAPAGSSGPWAMASFCMSHDGSRLHGLVGSLGGAQLQAGQIPWRGWPVQSRDASQHWQTGFWHQTTKPSNRSALERLLLCSADGEAIYAFSTYQLNLNDSLNAPWTLLEPTQARLWENASTWGDHFTLPVEWVTAACSADGKTILAAAEKRSSSVASPIFRYLILSNNWGREWRLLNEVGNGPWSHCALSANGGILMACANPGSIVMSRDGGKTWSVPAAFSSQSQPWIAVALSRSGLKAAACSTGAVHTSSDGGATWSQHRPQDVIVGQQARTLECMVMDSLGSRLALTDSSGALHLAQGSNADNDTWPLGLTLHPQHRSCNLGESSTLRIALLSLDANTTVQWYQRSSQGEAQQIKSGSGESALSYATPKDLGLGKHRYWAEIQSGGSELRSFDAVVNIVLPPTILKQPEDQYLLEKQRPSPLTVSLKNDPANGISLQWFAGQSGETSRPIAGANRASLSPPILPVGIHSFWVRASTREGGIADSRSTLITVSQPAAVQIQPTSIGLPSGQQAMVAVAATGTAPLAFQWVRVEGRREIPIAEATNSQWQSPALTQELNVRCIISNELRVGPTTKRFETRSNIVALTPLKPIAILLHPQDQDLDIDQRLTLRVSASGQHARYPLRYQWYQGDSGDSRAPMPGASATSPTWTSAPQQQAKTLTFWVQVHQGSLQNPIQSASSQTAHIRVRLPPLRLIKAPVSAQCFLGESRIYQMTVRGLGALYPVQYQWYLGSPGDTSQPFAGALNAQFLSPTGFQEGQHRFWVRAYQGSPLSPEQILDSEQLVHSTLLPPLLISRQPASLSVRLGAKPSFSVQATGGTPAFPLQYQWYQGQSGDLAQPIQLGTRATLILPSASNLGQSRYWVRIRQETDTGNLIHKLDSLEATLNVQ